MQFIRRYRSLLVFGAFLVLCSIMVVRQINHNQARHVELREAFILLYTRGYRPQAERLYQRLLRDLSHLPTRVMLDDFQRTLTLVDPQRNQPENLIWVYHWTVSNELEKRSEDSLKRALKLAGEQ
jgi:hypothetical protein